MIKIILLVLFMFSMGNAQFPQWGMASKSWIKSLFTGGTEDATFQGVTPTITIYDSDNETGATVDTSAIVLEANDLPSITLYDSAGNDATIQINQYGQMEFANNARYKFDEIVTIASNKAFYLDGGGNTFLRHPSADVLDIYTGNFIGIKIIEVSNNALPIFAYGLQIGGAAVDADSSTWIDDAARSGTASTTMYIGNSTIDVTAPSDASLKEIVGNPEEQTGRLMALKIVEFIRKSTGEHETGLIAQQVEEIYPEYVFEDNNGIKRIRYNQLITPLLIGFQEQQKRIDRLESMIE